MERTPIWTAITRKTSSTSVVLWFGVSMLSVELRSSRGSGAMVQDRSPLYVSSLKPSIASGLPPNHPLWRPATSFLWTLSLGGSPCLRKRRSPLQPLRNSKATTWSMISFMFRTSLPNFQTLEDLYVSLLISLTAPRSTWINLLPLPGMTTFTTVIQTPSSSLKKAISTLVLLVQKLAS